MEWLWWLVGWYWLLVPVHVHMYVYVLLLYQTCLNFVCVIILFVLTLFWSLRGCNCFKYAVCCACYIIDCSCLVCVCKSPLAITHTHSSSDTLTCVYTFIGTCIQGPPYIIVPVYFIFYSFSRTVFLEMIHFFCVLWCLFALESLESVVYMYLYRKS